jgi:hypothetical protein
MDPSLLLPVLPGIGCGPRVSGGCLHSGVLRVLELSLSDVVRNCGGTGGNFHSRPLLFQRRMNRVGSA